MLADAEAVEANAVCEFDLLHDLRDALSATLAGGAAVGQHFDEAIDSNPHHLFSPDSVNFNYIDVNRY